MKSNKGFTLIELLAVIVILAIIALIATPIILNVIDTARKGAKESSALGYIDAVEKQVMLAEVDATATKIGADHYKVSDLTTLGVEIKGETPDANGVVYIDTKGAVTEAWLKYDDYYVYYNLTNGKAVAKSSSSEEYTDGTNTVTKGTATYTASSTNTTPEPSNDPQNNG